MAHRAMKFLVAAFLSSQFHSYLGLITILPFYVLVGAVYAVTMDYNTSIPRELMRVMCTYQSL